MPQPDAQPDRTAPTILYCRCAYARVVPDEVKNQVLQQLAASGRSFDTVADLCEMSARRDPALKRIAEYANVRIAACYPRAVRGLFQAAGHPLPEDGVEILNMRTDAAENVVAALLTINGQPVEVGAEENAA